jgi:alcohol dehydrogenase
MLQGYAGYTGIPGHEFVGVVDRVTREDHRAWLGRRVVGEINIGCGTCPSCAAGLKEHCDRRTVLGIRGRDGGFAEYLSLPASNLHAVPDGLPDEAAVFVEPTAAACRILEQVQIQTGLPVAIVGDGRLGLLVAQVLATAGADVTLMGRHEKKILVARSLGLRAVVGGTDRPAFDLVVEATGRPSGLLRAAALVRPRGQIVLKSTFHGEAPPLWPMVVNEVTMIGSRCGPFPPAIEMLSSGRVRVTPLLAGSFPLDEHAAAFAAARTELKVLLRPDEFTT